MIVRAEGDDHLLIRQPDHAALTETLMAAWTRDGLPESPAPAPYAVAPMGHHAVSVYAPNRVYPHRATFFADMERMRSEHLATTVRVTFEQMQHDYFFVRTGDPLSLTCRCGGLELRQHGGSDLRWTGSRLPVQPDPSGGRGVATTIGGRLVRDGRVRTDAGPPLTIAAVATGS